MPNLFPNWHKPLTVAAIAGAAVLPTATAVAADPPVNDLFANATAITPDFSETVDTSMATSGEPEDSAAKDACGSPPFDSPAPPDATVWYALTVNGDGPEQIVVSAAPPEFVTPGFNVVVDTPDGFQCVTGGPVEVGFVAEPGVTYYIQSIDDQLPPDPEAPLDTENGGILNISVISLGTPQPELCPGVSPGNLPPGLNVIIGTDGDDHLRGTSGPDAIFGLGGDDFIVGRGGDDFIFGCDGHDMIFGERGNDVIFGDSVEFGDPDATGGDDFLRGGQGNDFVRGGGGDDFITGDNGDDELAGQTGDDQIRAGKGDDFAVGGRGDDEVSGGQGDDEVFGGRDSDWVSGGGGDDLVNGDLPAPFPDDAPHTDVCKGGAGTDEFANCEHIQGKQP